MQLSKTIIYTRGFGHGFFPFSHNNGFLYCLLYVDVRNVSMHMLLGLCLFDRSGYLKFILTVIAVIWL